MMDWKWLTEKIYGGFLGMNVGIRLGAPVEPAIWTAERIERVYGDIHGYVKEYKHFAADDDVNGPVFFLRALDDTDGAEPTPASVSEAYLNYAREGIGMFWWGGLGVSTEHTAYLNLLHGIPAPMSGSIRQNGSTVAEQIGGQIFIDTWGLIAPGDPARAARYARAAASVSHDGEALNGAAFIAACISAAFVHDSADAVMDEGLRQIPRESRYHQVVDAVRTFRARHPESTWKDCRLMLEKEWGYDRYPGACHVIPNAGVCALALAYGQGDFCRTVEIAVMCGWDTDCNAGNVGTIAGVLNGIGGIPALYRDPVNDELVLSGVSGYLNILDIPTYVWHLAYWAYRTAGLPVPDEVLSRRHPGAVRFDFSLPGATHGLRVSDPCLFRGQNKDGGYEVMWDRLERGQQAAVFLKTFYRRGDFSDERYKPVFSPIACPGQEAVIACDFEKWRGESVCVTPYIREALSGETMLLTTSILREDGSHTFRFILPEVDGGLIGEVGLHIEGNSPRITYDAGRLIIRRFEISGKADYSLRVGRMPEEFQNVLPFSQNHGSWHVEGDHIQALSVEHAEAATGNYFMTDVKVTGTVTPRNGPSHLVGVRVQGTRRGYYLGLDGENRVSILRHDGFALDRIAGGTFRWEPDRPYQICAEVRGRTLKLSIDGQEVLEAEDGRFAWGMAAYAMYAAGRTEFGDLRITEL